MILNKQKILNDKNLYKNSIIKKYNFDKILLKIKMKGR